MRLQPNGEHTYTFDLVEALNGAQHFHVASSSGDEVHNNTCARVAWRNRGSNAGLTRYQQPSEPEGTSKRTGVHTLLPLSADLRTGVRLDNRPTERMPSP